LDVDIGPRESFHLMGPVLLAVAALLLATPPGARGASARRAARTPPAAVKKEASRAAAGARHGAAGPVTLADAKVSMKALLRDRSRRRYRHHWEKAISGLVRAARGKDAPAALLEAARARYALYRWSANEADREEALRLAGKAGRAGSKDAPALAAAIRREAGDDRPARATAARPGPRRSPPAVAPAPEPGAGHATPPIDEPAPDAALEAALGELGEPASPVPLGDSSGEGAASVSEVKYWSSPDYTRVAIYLSHWVGWQRRELAPEGDRPRRLALDLRPAKLAGQALAREVASDRVDRVRAAQNDSETVRVVLDLPGRDGVQLFRLDDPPRLIVDVGPHPPHEAREPAARSEGRDAGETTPPGPRGEPAAGEEGARPPIRRVVVDAGHGGHDPGAIGPSRIREKDVTLAIARRLARRLRAAGFEVVLTRDTDRFLPLEERTALANTARGDLLVSIHANANPRRSLSGVETYFLNVADDRYAARLAARENGVDAADGESDTLRILTDLDAKASAGASQRLAGLVQREVCTGVRAKVGEVRDLGVKSALFYVLLGARMPAVLVETAFVSNRTEERRLASARYQDEVAAGVTRAIAAFARADARVAAR
jgi:N-acetylmuramoyl-L-alanine amidase